jgi:ferredoxin
MTAAHHVTIRNVARTIECAPGLTVLQAAMAAGIDYPFACATGNCGACVSELSQGSVSLLPYGDRTLTAAQRDAGQTLACRACPESDVEIAWLTRSPPMPA